MVLEDYLIETYSIDYKSSIVQEKVDELRGMSKDSVDYIRLCYLFVRDEIFHSWDMGADVVSRTASEVLFNGHGICWTKSCLLAALLRANGIASGISYQLLTRAEDDCDGYIIHALNTVFVDDLGRWVRLDARGNKDGLCDGFSLDEDILAFVVRPDFGEIDFLDNHVDLDERLVNVLAECEDIADIRTDFIF